MQVRKLGQIEKFECSPIAAAECRSAVDFSLLAVDVPYEARIARTAEEIRTALRLRFDVFKTEMGYAGASHFGLEFDEYDFRCRHLIVRDIISSRTVGTYRLSAFDTRLGASAFYSHSEFTIEDLPAGVLQEGIEIGRACVAADHRNTKVLFLLWKALGQHLMNSNKRYFFGCCSIFTTDGEVGRNAYFQLEAAGHIHDLLRVTPRKNAVVSGVRVWDKPVKLPGLFEMYLRLGAKVCGPPILDEEFGTIDFFVVLDLHAVPKKYRRMFFGIG